MVCLQGAVAPNSLTENATRRDVEEALTKWCTGARDRGGNRANRIKKAKERQQRAVERANENDIQN